MSTDFRTDIDRIQSIPAVPTILDVVCRATGMGFAAVARVTEERWIACQVLDNIDFGLEPGGELKVETTLCHEVRQLREVIAFDDALDDPAYANHHTPSLYGIRSYISVPIILEDGSFFGTLCAIDPKPAKVNNPQILGTFQLFAELIAHHINAAERLEAAEGDLERERDEGELREQFIAILGHDLRNPLAAVEAGANVLLRHGWTERAPEIVAGMKHSIARMSGLIANVLDFTRTRLGGGIVLDLAGTSSLREAIEHTVDEIRAAHPECEILLHTELREEIPVDHARICQMLSNLLANAFTHGAKGKPVLVGVKSSKGGFELVVANSGPAIPAEVLPKLFLPFSRSHTDSEGLGLGLYIADQLARAHGGTMSVVSDEEQTRFTFRMPANDLDAAPDAA